jgi:hypothetical protein
VNVAAFNLDIHKGHVVGPLRADGTFAINIDGIDMPTGFFVNNDGKSLATQYIKVDGRWQNGEPAADLRKRHGLQGPIDDAFLDRFIMVRPTGKPMNEKVGAWAKEECDHAIRQWHNIFRGEAMVKNDTEITDADVAASNLVLWGDPSSNKFLARIADKLPIGWDSKQIHLGSRTFDAATHAPILIFPNPLNPKKYVVINSGFTFREDANGTNSRQVPKLPDYAVVDLTEAPSAHRPGKIVAAGFFGEKWELREDDGKIEP